LSQIFKLEIKQNKIFYKNDKSLILSNYVTYSNLTKSQTLILKLVYGGLHQRN